MCLILYPPSGQIRTINLPIVYSDKDLSRFLSEWIRLSLGIFNNRGTKIPGAKSPKLLNFVLWLLMFVGLQYGTCFMSLF